MDNVIKLLLVLAGIMTLMIGGIFYVVLIATPDLKVEVKPAEAAMEAAAAEAPPPHEPTKLAVDLACDASSVAGTSCPDGYFCRFDTCVQVEAAKSCILGDSCRSCECDEGLVCHQFRCADPAKLDRTPLICEKNKRLAAAVKELADKCAERKKDVADIMRSGSCTSTDYEHLALEDEKFDLLLSAFPHRFAIHFQVGKPPLKSRDWPSATMLDHYVSEIRKFRGPLREAKQIFVIGRASPDGTPKINYDLSLKRMNLVSQMIEEIIYEGMTETEKSMHRTRIRSFTLPTAEPIVPERYRSTYLNNPDGTEPMEIEPLITWDDPSLKALQKALDDPAVVNGSGTRAWYDLHSTINRVVLVIPIPCLGNEYTPPIDDLARVKEAAG